MSDQVRVRGAAVRFPLPPLLFIVPLAITMCVHHWVLPWSIPGRPLTRVIGAVLTVAAVAFSLSGAGTFRRHRTTLAPHLPVARLVVSGPFRVSRNPMYTGLVIAYLGAALWVSTWWPLILLPLIVWATATWVVKPEEAYLAERFGDSYAAYRARVRRWL
jgi:protein-S-isoprenylcysteine O-methyltransferase Ste14